MQLTVQYFPDDDTVAVQIRALGRRLSIQHFRRQPVVDGIAVGIVEDLTRSHDGRTVCHHANMHTRAAGSE